ncbi:OmpL47-type beta-barrel domain-containing protein [Neobacillus sp. YIM B06451]|uniref:OmpL47-type beta-barrel domain-containing protein n=1 Tax=Neobacillus sp. YIM B06451 TaxID=3070994 RepID=UPI00292D1038|nr:Ig-like domain repeat protein [Neobacillus sp. YIM B06451]
MARVSVLLLLFSLLSPVSTGIAASDVTPPKLTSLSLSGTEATMGESITLSAELLEEESGVDIAYAHYIGPTGGSKTVYLIYNDETANYVGQFDVSTYDDAGQWKLSSVYLKDKQGNVYRIFHRETPYQGATYEYRNLSGYTIEVYGTLVDDTAPRLGDLSISSSSANGGESITLSADIIEEGSGVEYVHVSYVPPNGDSEGGKPIELTYNEETGKYEGSFYADPYDLPGIWSIGTIQMGDKLNNHYHYRNGETPYQGGYYEVKDLSAYNIEVFGTVGDTTPPQLNGFSVSQTTIIQGEQVHLSADIVDDLSGVEQVFVYYSTPLGRYDTRDLELSYNPETSRYEGVLAISESDPAGSWPLYGVEVVDQKGNFFMYYNSLENSKGQTFEHRDMSHANILVKAPDTSAPATSIDVQGQEGVDGWYSSSVIISLTAADNDAGVEKTLYRINGGEWLEYAGPFSLSADSTATVEYMSIDRAGNEESVQARTIKIDKQKPVTAIGDIPSYPVKVDVPLSFYAQDEMSGIARTEYRVNGGTWIQYTAPTYVRTEGTNTVEYRSFDRAGNAEDVKKAEFIIDKTAPTTSSSVKDGWTNNDVEASLIAADSISGVAKTEYRLNGGSWVVYTSPVMISGQGINTLQYRSIDMAGNVEATKQVEVKVDKTAPVTTTSVKGGWYNTDATLSLVRSDSHSGVAKTEYRLNGGAWATYTGSIVVSAEGINTLEYRSVDFAGNWEDVKTVQVKIDKTKPSLNVTFNPSVIIGNTGKLVYVKANVDARDALSGIASFELVSITSSQPDVINGKKIPEPDIQGAEYGTADTDFYLRNEISGSDRVYTITYKAFDNAGNSTVIASTIMVKKK